jgi:hypothetical protein
MKVLTKIFIQRQINHAMGRLTTGIGFADEHTEIDSRLVIQVFADLGGI